MKANASAGRKPQVNVFDHCEKLTVATQNDEEAGWLAALARVLMDGGTLIIHPKGRDRTCVDFGGCWGPEDDKIASP